MDWDDLEPKNKPKQKRNLDPLSIDELEDYILELEAEIERIKAEIARKKAHLTGADAFFKKPS